MTENIEVAYKVRDRSSQPLVSGVVNGVIALLYQANTEQINQCWGRLSVGLSLEKIFNSALLFQILLIIRLANLKIRQ